MMPEKSAAPAENSESVVISALSIGKHFKIYKDKPMTLKDRMLSFVKKSYDEFWALKDISIDIHKGESIGLIGHNGCGKSTLLKLFTRIIYPERGTITVKGQVSSLLELGAGFHPDFTGRENIYTNASIFGMKRGEIDGILQSIIDFSELGEFIDNPVRTYSSGMYMRLAFSVAIHVNPEILLIDEILAVGDTNFQKKCLDKIVSFKKDGVTIVIVSHDLATIERICDRVVWLDGGIIRSEGNPHLVINAYLAQMAENQNVQMTASAESAVEEVVEEQERSRFGNKSIEIMKVELLDKTGKSRVVFDVEDSMEIIITYKKNTAVENAGFGIGIFGTDGAQRYGTNTYIDGVHCEIENVGRISCIIERLGFTDGSYWLDIATHDAMGTPYDYIHKMAEFSTTSAIKDVGLARPLHKWNVGSK